MDKKINKFIQIISNELGINESQIQRTIKLLDDGATIPFIARYRKEMTGSLDEVNIENISSRYKSLLELDQRKETILKAIDEQGKLDHNLKNAILNTFDSKELEDLYLPYKRKKQTKAGVARSNGLEPLAEIILKQKNVNLFQEAAKYISKDVKSKDEAIEGAQHIVAEIISEDVKFREQTRKALSEHGSILSKVVKKKQDEADKYKDYFDFEERLSKCPSHRLLAILRGNNEGFLRIKLDMDHERNLQKCFRRYISWQGNHVKYLKEAIEDGYQRLILPSIENQVLSDFKLNADKVAIDVFVKNLRQLLLSQPLGQKSILALDPGFRTGCKVVVLDQNGNLLENTTVFPNPPQSNYQESKHIIENLLNKYNIHHVAIGNGTASRETKSFISSLKDFNLEVFIVNEDGASIYSASEIAREEFPDKDVTVRGAVSIGRRLMDPLAELVKIDPKSIGVGQYQYDVNQSLLKESLDNTVISCVNSVGINLNTASKHLLTYISGLGPTLAENIVDHRKTNGDFLDLKEIKQVKRLGEKAFEQAAGFLRIRNGKNPLDNTGVHPESYDIVKMMAKDYGLTIKELIQNKEVLKQIDLKKYITATIGLPTLKDIIKELEKPGLDPRGSAKTFEFDDRLKTIEDVREGMILPGIITNVTNFGAFVDIGVKENGLVHISQISNTFISNPADVLSLNQQVSVKVLEVDIHRKRINLTMKDLNN